MTPKKELLFCALGGSGEIGMNVNLYGTEGKWVMVDCGITFADPAYPGIDVILPDLSFIEDRLDTLMHVIADPALEDVRLYLADWGYNTPRQREEAAALPRIEVVSVKAFRRLQGL